LLSTIDLFTVDEVITIGRQEIETEALTEMIIRS